MLKRTIFFLLFLLVHSLLIAQNKSELQKQRDQLKDEIEQTQQLLEQTKKTAKVSIGQLALINRKVNLQENIVESVHSEIRHLSDEIYLSQLEINRMNRVLDTLKDEYARSMVYAYKNRGNYSFLNFIFASQSFNDAIKRIAYLKYYRNYREMQAENILKTQALLQEKIVALAESKKRKGVVLDEEGKEMSKLENQKQEKALVVKELSGKQKELNAIIRSKRKEDNKLKGAIAAMVKREIELARAEAAKKEKARLEALKKEKEKTAATKPTENNTASNTKPKEPDVAPKKVAPPVNSVLVSTDADVTLNANFEKNKGSLPWPVNGYVLYKFGKNVLPGNIDYENYGVTIASQIGAPVKAVFDGEVTLVSFIEDNQAVYIKHGRYFTVYSNLTGVTVKRGDMVKTGQTIGKAGENDEGEGGRVEFLLLKESDYQNPQSWLK